jgi:hypothetical protein
MGGVPAFRRRVVPSSSVSTVQGLRSLRSPVNVIQHRLPTKAALLLIAVIVCKLLARFFLRGGVRGASRSGLVTPQINVWILINLSLILGSGCLRVSKALAGSYTLCCISLHTTTLGAALSPCPSVVVLGSITPV